MATNQHTNEIGTKVVNELIRNQIVERTVDEKVDLCSFNREIIKSFIYYKNSNIYLSLLKVVIIMEATPFSKGNNQSAWWVGLKRTLLLMLGVFIVLENPLKYAMNTEVL